MASTNTSPNSILIFSMGAFLLFSCTNRTNKDGGACSYKTTILPAKIIAITSYDSTRSDIIFRIVNKDGSSFIDSLSWYRKTKNLIEKTQIKKEHIETGQVFTYEIMKIINGSCNPTIETIKLEKFKQQ